MAGWAISWAISIHAPHAGCDDGDEYEAIFGEVISIHAPHAGCDTTAKYTPEKQNAFQSTHPMRGATAIIA